MLTAALGIGLPGNMLAGNRGQGVIGAGEGTNRASQDV